MGDANLLANYGVADAIGRILGYAVIRYTHMTLNKECAQARGVYNYMLVGVYYQRGLFLSGLLIIVLTTFLYLSDKILMAFGLEREMALRAGDFRWVNIFFFLYKRDCMRKILGNWIVLYNNYLKYFRWEIMSKRIIIF